MTIALGTLTVTVVPIEAGGRDRYGKTAATPGTPFDLLLCNLQQKRSDEVVTGEAGTTVTEWLLFAPDPSPNAVRARDLIRIDAALAHVAPDPAQTYATFSIDGDVDHLEHIDGLVHHLELNLRRAQL